MSSGNTLHCVSVLCDPLQTTHDSMGLVYDWVSELKFTVDKNLLDYLRDTHHIDVNPQNGEFTFDLECNAEQVISEFGVYRLSMYIDMRCHTWRTLGSYDDEYEQGQNGAYYSERAYTRVTVRRTYDSDKPTANELGMYSE